MAQVCLAIGLLKDLKKNILVIFYPLLGSKSWWTNLKLELIAHTNRLPLSLDFEREYCSNIPPSDSAKMCWDYCDETAHINEI